MHDLQRRAALIAIAAVGLVGVTLVPASADEPQPLVPATYVEVVGAGPTYWDMYPDESSCEVSNGFTPASDGAFGPDYSQSDAFDNGLEMSVNGKDVPDKDGLLDVRANEVIAGGGKIDGVKIWRTERALATSPTLRTLVRFDNTAGSAQTMRVLWDSDLGSDGFEAVRASSDGDTTYDVSDRWVVSSDDPTTPSDPVLTFALFGRKARVGTKAIVNGFGSGCFTVKFAFRVPAHSTRYLLFFTQMNGTNEKALTRATKFDKPADPLLAGLPDTVLSEIVNWSL